MVIGLFVRHYKVYQGVNYIPICEDYDAKYTSFIGDNGVGKSSTLEALNTFFNNGYWNITKNVKKAEAFVSPIFLIEKDRLKKKVGDDKKLLDMLELTSSYFWGVNTAANGNLSKPEYEAFFNQRDELKCNIDPEKYYLILMGIKYDSKSEPTFITFEKDLENQGLRKFEETEKCDRNIMLEAIKAYYKYIYIPVQISSSDVLRIESKEIQNLMNSNILEDIDKILNEKKFEKTKRKFISVIDYLNESLNLYMDDVNQVIQKIDKAYEFKVEGGYKKNLTSSDVRMKILEAYFSIRTLKKEKKEIEELSSGEQRIAIIDIATSFLTNNIDNSEQVIFAIDEPESSLHISKAFSQFERLNKLSDSHQILLTTHWYGSLPITHKGCLVHLEKVVIDKIRISKFKLDNYFEGRKYLPKDIMLKGYFELTASILSCMRAEKINWIICEGTDDKIYIEHYLGKKINNLKVFSVGGCGNVIKLFKYLYIPLSEKDESEDVESKILCIVDTDENIISIDGESQTKNKKLKISRLQIDNRYKIELKNMDINGNHFTTEIEDCLKPKLLFDAVKCVVNKQGTSEEKEVLSYYGFNENMPVSKVKGEKSIFKLVDIKGADRKEKIYEVFDNNQLKFSICKKYIELDEESKDDIPSMFKAMLDFFVVQ
ncbi:AAA family ATPase [Cellulosilyticum sp. WCF-2]|uniref:AAA family ATPase n=1 Tax=Cellulosilyticum sp. WCF-2 TaxID=2497860 RepID=UPI00167FF9D2|nr:AAA family ATPase [Cellulosilyticum sp. WCF-2]